MLKLLAMRSTVAALNCGSKAGPAVPLRVLQGTRKVSLAMRTSSCSMFSTAWPRQELSGSAGEQKGAHGAAVPASQAYAYDGVEASAAEIGEVDFNPALANTVRLIGTVGGKRELKVFERSKLLPFAIGIKPNRRKPEDIEWVNVEVWGPLAERADQHLQKGDRVAVQGRLRVDRWEDRATGQKRNAMKIVASSISKVRSLYADQGQQTAGGAGGSFDQHPVAAGGAPWDTVHPQQAVEAPWDLPAAAATQGLGQPPSQQQQNTVEELWMDFFMSPDQWYDNRVGKRNPNAPDFKKKTGGIEAPALWVEGRSTPQWVKGELERLDALRV